MIRIIHTADLHLGISFSSIIESPSFEEIRFKDLINNLEYIKDYAIKNNADFLIIAGDVFHNPRPSALAFNEFSRIIGELVKNDVNVIITLGNHDSFRTREALSYLKGIVNLGVERYHLFDKASAKIIEARNGEKIKFIGLPYPHFQSDYSYSDFVDFYEEKFNEIRRSISGEDYEIAIGHLMIEGGKLGSEQFIASLKDHPIPTRIFEGLDLACMGHLHRAQRIGEKIFYSGSIERIDFREEGEEKSFLDILLSEKIEAKAVPLKLREMKTIDFELKNLMIESEIQEKIEKLKIEEGSILRLRLFLDTGAKIPNIRFLEKNLKEKFKLAALKIEIKRKELASFQLASSPKDFSSFLKEYIDKKYKEKSDEFKRNLLNEAINIMDEVARS